MSELLTFSDIRQKALRGEDLSDEELKRAIDLAYAERRPIHEKKKEKDDANTKKALDKLESLIKGGGKNGKA